MHACLKNNLVCVTTYDDNCELTENKKSNKGKKGGWFKKFTRRWWKGKGKRKGKGKKSKGKKKDEKKS